MSGPHELKSEIFLTRRVPRRERNEISKKLEALTVTLKLCEIDVKREIGGVENKTQTLD